MVPFIAVVALLIFIYMNRYVQRRREERRAESLDRKQELLDKLLDTIRSAEEKKKTDSNEN